MCFSVWMVRFDGRRWINLGSVFFVFIYTHNTLNYSYSLWKEEKGGKEIFVLGNREKTDSVLENWKRERISGIGNLSR